MKINLWNIILILALFFGCQNNRSLNGNYSLCTNGEYLEIYFKNDSMRIASNNDWVKLSKWKKIEIKNDTLYFETFGEMIDSSKAEIKYHGISKIELRFSENDKKQYLEPINGNLNFDNSKEFWKGFNNRLNSKKCE